MDDYPPGSTTYELATIGNRFIAAIIDDLLLLVISFVIALILAPFLSDFTALILGIGLNAAYYSYFWTQNDGQTPGKRLMHIQVIKTDGTPLTLSDSLLRVFGYYVGRVTIGLGYLWAVFDANHQAWHDKMANTYVVVADAEKAKKFIEI